MHYKWASFAYVGCCDPEILLGFIQVKLFLMHSEPYFPRARYVQDLLQDQHRTMIFLVYRERGFL